MANYPQLDDCSGVWKLKDVNNAVSGGYWRTVGGSRFVIGGGFAPGYSNVIDFANVSSAGNAADFGDLSLPKGENGCAGNFTRAIWFGGNIAADPNATNVIDYVTFSTTGNAADFGDLSAAATRTTGVSGNATRVVATEGTSDADQLTYFNPTSTGNAVDFGNLTQARAFVAGMTSPTRGVFAGGFSPTLRDTIDFIEIATTGNASDFGNLVTADRKGMSTSSSTRGVYGGGLSATLTQFLTIASQGNMTTYGDLSSVRIEPATGTNSVRAVFAGGQVPGTSNIMEQFEIPTGGNAVDFGDLTAARYSTSGNTNSHGGLNDGYQGTRNVNLPFATPLRFGAAGVGDLGLFHPNNKNLQFIQISTTGNASDFGDMEQVVAQSGGTASSTRAVSMGGRTPSTFSIDTIRTTEFKSKGNVSDFGNLVVASSYMNGGGNSTRGLKAGGAAASPAGAVQDNIEYITIATLGDATDFGNLTTASKEKIGGQMGNTTRAVFAGGKSPGYGNIIEYVTIANTGNATDFGNLTSSRSYVAQTSSTLRGITAGGYGPNANLNTIEFITIASTGDATDFGDLTVVRAAAGANTNNVRGTFSGGYSNQNHDTIDFVTIASAGNASDFGDMAIAAEVYFSASNGHGGLS